MKRVPPVGAPIDDRAVNVVATMLDRLWLGPVVRAGYADQRAVRTSRTLALTLVLTDRPRRRAGQ